MDKNLYVVHFSETEEKLQDLSLVLNKAGFRYIKFITKTELLELLNKDIIPNFTLSIQRTYRDLTGIYSQKLDVQVHEFFSKEFCNLNKGICLSGLPFSISEIFNDQYKRHAWSIITNLYSNYSKILLNHNVEEPISNAQEIIIEDLKEDDKAQEEIMSSAELPDSQEASFISIEDSKQESIFTDESKTIEIPIKEESTEVDEDKQLSLDLQEQYVNEDYEFYKAFYNKYSKIITLFDELKSDIKRGL